MRVDWLAAGLRRTKRRVEQYRLAHQALIESIEVLFGNNQVVAVVFINGLRYVEVGAGYVTYRSNIALTASTARCLDPAAVILKEALTVYLVYSSVHRNTCITTVEGLLL